MLGHKHGGAIRGRGQRAHAQAYETVGVKNVNEQMIYNEMLSTADIIYDPATGQDYHRLNLERAIDSIMASWTPPPAAAATPTSSTTSSTTTPAAPVAVKTSARIAPSLPRLLQRLSLLLQQPHRLPLRLWRLLLLLVLL